MNTGSNRADENRRRGLEDNVRDEEDEICNVLAIEISCWSALVLCSTYVAEVDSQDELLTHTRNIRRTHIRSVHQTNTVHGTNSNYKTTINPSHDAVLLLRREAMIIGMSVNRLCLFKGVDMAVLLGEGLLQFAARTVLHVDDERP